MLLEMLYNREKKVHVLSEIRPKELPVFGARK